MSNNIDTLSANTVKATRAVIKGESALGHATVNLTNCVIALMQVAGTTGDALTMALMPVVKVVMDEKGLEEKDAKRWLAVYTSTARRALEVKLPLNEEGKLTGSFRDIRENIKAADNAAVKAGEKAPVNKGGRKATDAVTRVQTYLEKEDTETVLAAIMAWSKAGKNKERLLAYLNR